MKVHKMYKSALIVHKIFALTVDVFEGGCVVAYNQGKVDLIPARHTRHMHKADLC